MDPKGNSMELGTFLKNGLTKVKKNSIVEVQRGSKHVYVNITLQVFT